MSVTNPSRCPRLLDLLRPALPRDLLLHVATLLDNRGRSSAVYGDDYKVLALTLAEEAGTGKQDGAE